MVASQEDQYRRTLSVSLFLTGCIAKGLATVGRAPLGALSTLLLSLWQEAFLAALLWGMGHWLKRGILTCVYGVLVAWMAINVPVIRVLGTPLTRKLLQAAGGALNDSIAMYFTLSTVAVFASVVCAALLLPSWHWKLPARLGWAFAIAAGIGFLVRPSDPNGIARNSVVTLLVSFLPASLSEEGGEGLRIPLQKTAPGPLLKDWIGQARGRNVVLVALESTGAQYLGLYGAKQDPMPFLTRTLGGEGALVFEHGYAVYPESIKGLFSVLCSVAPSLDTVAEDYAHWKRPCLPQLLKDKGYATGLFHSGRFQYLGMEAIVRDRGYDTLEDAGHITGRMKSSFGLDDERQAVRRMLQWTEGKKTFFLHYMPVAGHHPYSSPDPALFKGDDDFTLYKNSLHHADTALAMLLEGLKQQNQFDNTLFIFYGDHAEGFNQHPGNVAHTLFIYEENVHVPLAFYVPGKTLAARTPSVMSLLDLTPTTLALLGEAQPEHMQGSNRLLAAEEIAFFFTDYSLIQLGLRDGRRKYIYHKTQSTDLLFDLQTDSQEKQNLASAYPTEATQYRKRVLQWGAEQKKTLKKVIGAPLAKPAPHF